MIKDLRGKATLIVKDNWVSVSFYSLFALTILLAHRGLQYPVSVEKSVSLIFVVFFSIISLLAFASFISMKRYLSITNSEIVKNKESLGNFLIDSAVKLTFIPMTICLLASAYNFFT